MNEKSEMMEKYGFDIPALCGCADEDEVAATVKKVLEWHSIPAIDRPEYTALFNDSGAFYLVVMVLGQSNLVTHGTSCRVGFLTDEGEKLLHILKERIKG